MKLQKPETSEQTLQGISKGIQPSAQPRPNWVWLGLGAGILLIGLGFFLTRQSPSQPVASGQPAPQTSTSAPTIAPSDADQQALVCARILPQMAHQWKKRNPTASGYPALPTLMVKAWKSATHPCNNTNLTFTGAATLGPYSYTIQHALGSKTFEVTPESIFQDGKFLEKTARHP